MRGAICEIVSELGGEGTWFATRKSRMRLGLSSCGQLYRLALPVFSIEDFNLEIWKTPLQFPDGLPCGSHPSAAGTDRASNTRAPRGPLPSEVIQLRNMDGDRWRTPCERAASTPLRCQIPSISSPIDATLRLLEMIGVCIGGKKSRLDFEASANASAELLAAHSGLTFSHG